MQKLGIILEYEAFSLSFDCRSRPRINKRPPEIKLTSRKELLSHHCPYHQMG